MIFFSFNKVILNFGVFYFEECRLGIPRIGTLLVGNCGELQSTEGEGRNDASFCFFKENLWKKLLSNIH